jgi:hypothetical protein
MKGIGKVVQGENLIEFKQEPKPQKGLWDDSDEEDAAPQPSMIRKT